MRALRAFLLGALAVGVLAYSVSAALAVTAQAGGRALDLALGPLTLVAASREGAETVTTFGVGLVLLALAGGVANLSAAHVIRRHSATGGDRVD